jgi:hypothetical protein
MKQFLWGFLACTVMFAALAEAPGIRLTWTKHTRQLAYCGHVVLEMFPTRVASR